MYIKGMKKIILLPLTVLLTACGTAKIQIQVVEALKEPEIPKLSEVISGYNVSGYTKKTQFTLTEETRSDKSNFHNGANAENRLTYYSADNSALLMGNYDGTFGSINSGYRNIEGGVQHFKHVGEATADHLFEEIEDDWAMEDQSVGGYYPTLKALSELEGIDDWDYADGIYTHTITNLEIIDGVYNDINLHKFQYFAAPMLLMNNTFSWTSIKIKDCSTYLSIKLYSDFEKDKDKSILHEGNEVLISYAEVYKGINL